MTLLLGDGELVEVWGAEEEPDGFIWRNAAHDILEVTNRWRIHTRWWEPRKTIWRDYLKIVTSSGMLCQIYHDLERGGWYLARIYD